MVAACDSEDVCRTEAALSRVVLYEKDELLGSWEHTAIVRDPGGSTAAVGATSPAERVRWIFSEELLVATRPVVPLDPVAAFRVEGHYTQGAFSDGSLCIASWDGPWDSETHARIDWSMELIADSTLPLDVVDGVVEPVPFFVDDYDFYEDSPRFERDDAGVLRSVELPAQYWVQCSGCGTGPVEVVHRFRRMD